MRRALARNRKVVGQRRGLDGGEDRTRHGLVLRACAQPFLGEFNEGIGKARAEFLFRVTTESVRIRRGESGTAASCPSLISLAMVARDMMANPSPVLTSPLIASGLPSSMTVSRLSGWIPAFWK